MEKELLQEIARETTSNEELQARIVAYLTRHTEIVTQEDADTLGMMAAVYCDAWDEAQQPGGRP